MNKPKQKPRMQTPKVIDKTLRTQDRVQSVTSKMKDTSPDNDNTNSNEYATNTVTETGKHIMQGNTETTIATGKTIAKKGIDIAKTHYLNKRNENIYSNQSSFTKHNPKPDIREKQKQYCKATQSKQSYKQTQRATQTRTHTTLKTKGSNTIKRTQKTVKNTRRNVKTIQHTAQQSAKTTKKSAIMAKRVAKTSVRTVKTTIKAVVIATKATIAAVKSLIAAIAAGGWIVVAIIIVIALILYLIASPWGIFFEDANEHTPTIPELVTQLNNEYNEHIAQIISDANDIDEVITDVDTSTSYLQPSNWVDVLCVFAVKSSANPDKNDYMDVLIMDDRKIEKLRDIFWDMNSVTYEIDEEIIDITPEPTEANPTPEPSFDIYRTLMIHIETLSAEQASEEYHFNQRQEKLLDELMTPYYTTLFMELCGTSSYNGLTPEEMNQLINNLPSSNVGSDIVKYALSRLGDPYSQPKRGQGNYVDCSYLTRWCYQQAGVTNFTAPTAASQAQYCVDNHLTIAKSDLQPGDLIFWSFKANGRFMNITHVGIYAGDGMVIDASSSRGMVVYREIFGGNNQVCYGRDYAK